MNFNEYQIAASRTAYPPRPDFADHDLCVTALGLAGESGEVADMIKKWVGHKHPRDVVKMKEELGDVLWYLARMATLMGCTLDEVARMNVAKLEKRYPDGFSSQASIERKA